MITYTVEKLYHFQCGECLQWFSIGDAPREIVEGPITCPACGHSIIPEAKG